MLKYLAALARRLFDWSPRTKPEHEDIQLELTIEAAIDLATQDNKHVSIPFRNGDVYAYPYGFGGIAWGVNGGRYGFCIIQGIRGGPEGDKRWKTRNM